MKFTARFLILAIPKSKANFLAKQCGITVEEVEKVSESDPSPTSAFTGWLCHIYKTDKDIPLVESLFEPLKNFIKICHNPEFPKEKRDIGRYTPEELLTLTGNPRAYRRNLSQKGIEKLIMEEGVPGAELIWNAKGFKMWKVSNPRYARFLSSNTSWCTAQVSYSEDYCSKGHLYPIYFKNKPLVQGYQSQRSTDIEFLNKEDHQIDLTQPEILFMLQSITHPIMRNFEAKTLNSDKLDELIRKGEDGITTAKQLAFHSQNAQAIASVTKALQKGKEEWWVEGLEFLLDYPALMKRVILNESSVDGAEKLAKLDPVLAKEIAYELQAENYFVAKSIPWLIALGGEVSEETKKEAMENLLENPEKFGNSTFFAKLVNDMVMSYNFAEGSARTSGKLASLLTLNSGNESLIPAAMHLWREFKHSNAWQCKLVLDQPEYTERMAAIKEAITAPNYGKKVVPGPDFEGDVPNGTQGTITGVVPEENGFTCTVEWDNGVTGEVMIAPKLGYYGLSRSSGSREPIKILVADVPLKVGDTVSPSPDWKRTQIVPMGSYGIVTDVENREAGRETLIQVDWDHELPRWEESRDWDGFYAHRLVKVMNVEIDADGTMYNEEGKEVDKKGEVITPLSLDSTGKYTRLIPDDSVKIGGGWYEVRDGADGTVYLMNAAELIFSVLGDDDEEAKHLYAESVSGEHSNRGKRSPELSPEGLAKLANALIAVIGE